MVSDVFVIQLLKKDRVAKYNEKPRNVQNHQINPNIKYSNHPNIIPLLTRFIRVVYEGKQA